MDFVYYLIKYIPFWAVPIWLICIEFAYIFWLKSIRRVSFIFIGIGGCMPFFIGFYYYAGGPDGAVKLFMDIVSQAEKIK